MQQSQSKWNLYVQNCFKYNAAPVENVKKCLDEEEYDLNLSVCITYMGFRVLFDNWFDLIYLFMGERSTTSHEA